MREEVLKEIGFKVSRENDQIDEKYGFARIPRKELVI
jgi:hypothetical protein